MVDRSPEFTSAEFVARVKRYRVLNECSLQEAATAIRKQVRIEQVTAAQTVEDLKLIMIGMLEHGY